MFTGHVVHKENIKINNLRIQEMKGNQTLFVRNSLSTISNDCISMHEMLESGRSNHHFKHISKFRQSHVHHCVASPSNRGF